MPQDRPTWSTKPKSARLVCLSWLIPATVVTGQDLAKSEAGTELLHTAGEGFRLWTTDHFLIAYDTPPDAVRTLVGRLEGVFDAIGRFRRGNRLDGTAPTQPLPVVFYSSFGDFRQYLSRSGVGSASVAGVYLQNSNVAAFCHTLNTPSLEPLLREIGRLERQVHRASPSSGRSGRDALLRQLNSLRVQRDSLVRRFDRLVIQHEAAHQVLFNVGVHVLGGENPTWLVEGLACQFETPQPSANGLLTEINQLRLGDFRQALDASPQVKTVVDHQWRKALDARRLLPIRELISHPEEMTPAGGLIAYRYGQAWALVFYLHRWKRDAFADYLRELGRRRPGVAVSGDDEIRIFERHFGPADADGDRSMADLIMRLRYDPRDSD